MDNVIILGTIDPSDNTQLYWSNEIGWVSKENATVFSKEELTNHSLPIGYTGIQEIDTEL